MKKQEGDVARRLEAPDPDLRHPSDRTAPPPPRIGRRLRERKSVHHLAVLPEVKPEPMQCDRTMTRVERQEYRRLNGLCFYCGDSTHAISDCPKRTKRSARSAVIGQVESSDCPGVDSVVDRLQQIWTQPYVVALQIGDRVMAFVNYNAWAEVTCTPAEFVYKIPDDMSFSEATAFPMNFVTAYMMLFEVANLREGMSVLVHSAGGGVGQAVAQLCSTVPNVTVFGTASAFKHEAIKNSLNHLFDRNADYVQEVKKISPEGVDIVLDCLCGENTGKGIGLLKPLGTYILYGSSNMVTGETKSFFSFAKSWWQVEKVNPIKLYEENKVMSGFSLLNLLFKQGRAGVIRGVVDKLLDLYNQKKIKPLVDSLWALEEVKEAMQRIHDRGNIGKLILDVEKAPTPLVSTNFSELFL
ncbi:unnamed protein product [Ranitomeya imitator]|uniref:CCHC-type domain-containing protein n=1 Tax=Ranitomeya imitator TaxID=111125 RepID=A0ABN9M224_9NEOB|nr:unnamed protein product [Ranitomeya imitator]